MDVHTDLVFNYLMDLKKKDIDPLERARVLHEYCEEKHLSQRDLAKLLQMPKSTIDDWFMWNRLDEDDIKEMRKNGLNDTDIYRQLRNGKKTAKKDLVIKTDLDCALEDTKKILSKFVTKVSLNTSKYTLQNLREIKDMLNRIEMHIMKDRR